MQGGIYQCPLSVRPSRNEFALPVLQSYHDRGKNGTARIQACALTDSDSSPKKIQLGASVPKSVGLGAIGAGVGIAASYLLQLGGAGRSGGGSSGFGGWGGGGGSGGGPFWRFWTDGLAALADSQEQDDSAETYDHHGLNPGDKIPLTKIPPGKRYKITGVELFDNKALESVASDDPFYELLTIRSGGIYTKAQLQAELENLTNSGMFEKIEIEGMAQVDGTFKAKIRFSESEWQGAENFRCVNVGLLPQTKPPDADPMKMSDREREDFIRNQEEEYKNRLESARNCNLPPVVLLDISSWLKGERRVTARMLQRIRDKVQKWYHDNGFACAQVVNFGNLNTDEVVCEVVEGDITQLIIQFQDKMGTPCEGNTQVEIVRRELPRQLEPGFVFNIEAGKKALRNLNALGIFSNIEVNPRPDEEEDGGIVVEVKLKELEQKTAEVSTEWSVVPGRSGRPSLASIQPGGSVTLEHRNLQGLNRSLLGSVTSNNLLNPQDDLGFKMEYVCPYIDGIKDRRNRTFRVSCFNSRKLSPVFTGGPGMEEVPAVWVDRAGIKANITELYTRQSKFTYGLVFEEVTTRDETSAICTNSARTLPSGALSMDGPPTTLSDTGMDRLGFLQLNITRDNTRFVNGTPVGARDIFQVDQGLGIGSKFPFFNRHQLSMTRFIQLLKVEEGTDKPPPLVAVFHGRYGGCVGDLAAYDAFTLGGPYSVRGYNMGELGACRNLLELAMELRVPVMKTHAYGFIEYGTDLESSKALRGNPTEFFRRAGQGASYGVGVKLGLMRAEYAQDCNMGTGSFFVRFGERF